jgi:hypothetical protein
MRCRPVAPRLTCRLASLRPWSIGSSRRHERRRPTRNPLPFGWLPDRITINDIEAALIRQGTQMVCDGKEFVAGCDCVASNQRQATAR